MGARGQPSTRRNLVLLVSERLMKSKKGAKDRACYRPWTMRASYLSQDRCELQFAVKELAKRMQQPNTKNMQALKRLVGHVQQTS